MRNKRFIHDMAEHMKSLASNETLELVLNRQNLHLSLAAMLFHEIKIVEDILYNCSMRTEVWQHLLVRKCRV